VSKADELRLLRDAIKSFPDALPSGAPTAS
jgi:hypothetical protein